MATIKGQNLRVLIGPDAEHLKCVAAATNCQIHLTLEVQEDTTKDTTDDWLINEPVGINWDVQVDALVVNDPEDTDSVHADALVPGMIYMLQFSRTAGSTGEHNRDAVADLIQMTGNAYLSDLVYNATNQDLVTAAAKFAGSGELVETNPE